MVSHRRHESHRLSSRPCRIITFFSSVMNVKSICREKPPSSSKLSFAMISDACAEINSRLICGLFFSTHHRHYNIGHKQIDGTRKILCARVEHVIALPFQGRLREITIPPHLPPREMSRVLSVKRFKNMDEDILVLICT
jgi:hypothetical protein